MKSLVSPVLLTLFLAVVPAAAQAPQLQPSACEPGALRPPGVGYTPPPGSQSCLFSEPNGAGKKACHPMDLSAHPFAGRVEDASAAVRRYGPNFHGIDFQAPRFLAVDFEALLQVGNIQLQTLCCQNTWGTAKSLSCYPTDEELHDYWAVNPGQASSAGAGAVTPGQPAITAISSPSPGRVALSWKTRAGHSAFEVHVGSVTTATRGDVFETTVDLPPAEGGDVEAYVVAFIGAKGGKPSRARTVGVVPRATPRPPDAPVPPVLPPAPVRKACQNIDVLPVGSIVTGEVREGWYYHAGEASTGRLTLRIVPVEECEVRP